MITTTARQLWVVVAAFEAGELLIDYNKTVHSELIITHGLLLIGKFFPLKRVF